MAHLPGGSCSHAVHQLGVSGQQLQAAHQARELARRGLSQQLQEDALLLRHGRRRTPPRERGEKRQVSAENFLSLKPKNELWLRSARSLGQARMMAGARAPLQELSSNGEPQLDLKALRELSAFVRRDADGRDADTAAREALSLVALVFHGWRGTLAEPGKATHRARAHFKQAALAAALSAWRGEAADAKQLHARRLQHLTVVRQRLVLGAWHGACSHSKQQLAGYLRLRSARLSAAVLRDWKGHAAEAAVRRAQAVEVLQNGRRTDLASTACAALSANASAARAAASTAQAQYRRVLLGRALRAWRAQVSRAAWLHNAGVALASRLKQLRVVRAWHAWRHEYVARAVAARALRERALAWRAQRLGLSTLRAWADATRHARLELARSRLAACLAAWRAVVAEEQRAMRARRLARSFFTWRAVRVGNAAQKRAMHDMMHRAKAAAAAPPPPLTAAETRRLEGVIVAFERLVAEHAQCTSAAKSLGHTPQAGALLARCAHLAEEKRRQAPLVRMAAQRLQEQLR